MAQEKKLEAGAVADLKGGEGQRMAANAYGDIGPDRVVLLLGNASSPTGAAGYYPLAAARLKDLPEELRRKLVDGRAGCGGLPAVALAALSGGGPAARYLLVHAVVPEDIRRRQLAGEAPPPVHWSDHFAIGYDGYGGRDEISSDLSELRVIQAKDDEGRVVYQLDANPQRQVLEAENIHGGLVELRNGFPASVEVSGVLCLDTAAFAREHGAPFSGEAQFGTNGAAGFGLGALAPSGLVVVRDGTVPFVEKLRCNNCADEQGALYSDGRPSPYAVQVVVDAAVGAKDGDPIPLGAGKLTGADAGNDGGGSLSAVVGVFAASSAVTAVAAGTISPPVAFGFFLVLLGGVALAMARVRDL